MLAAARGHVHVVESLCAFGCDAAQRNEFKQTPFHFAVREKRRCVVRLLLNLQAETTRSDKFGWNVGRSDSAEIRSLMDRFSEKSVSWFLFFC